MRAFWRGFRDGDRQRARVGRRGLAKGDSMAVLLPASRIAGTPAANLQRSAAETTSLCWTGVRENAAVEDFLSGKCRGVPQFLGLSNLGGSAGAIHG